MTPVRFGFIGAGFIAQTALAPAVHAAAGVQLQAAAASDVERARLLEPAGRSYGRYEELVEDPEVDVVYISLTNEQHLPWILRALECGKHVLCEKPLGMSATEVRQGFEAARRHDRLLVEAMWHRWHPRTQRAASLVRSGHTGAVEHIAAGFCFDGVPADNYRLEPKRGGGALYDVGCYTLSALQWALPAPLSVMDARFDVGQSGVDLTVRSTLAGATGTADITASINQPDRQQLAITGAELRVQFTDEAFSSWRAKSSLALLGADGPTVEDFAAVDAYQLMVEAVATRCRGYEAFVVEPEESIALAQLMDEVRVKAERGGA